MCDLHRALPFLAWQRLRRPFQLGADRAHLALAPLDLQIRHLALLPRRLRANPVAVAGEDLAEILPFDAQADRIVGAVDFGVDELEEATDGSENLLHGVLLDRVYFLLLFSKNISGGKRAMF